jgi:hypothetical protein
MLLSSRERPGWSQTIPEAQAMAIKTQFILLLFNNTLSTVKFIKFQIRWEEAINSE